jgi:hypothetical protein
VQPPKQLNLTAAPGMTACLCVSVHLGAWSGARCRHSSSAVQLPVRTRGSHCALLTLYGNDHVDVRTRADHSNEYD